MRPEYRLRTSKRSFGCAVRGRLRSAYTGKTMQVVDGNPLKKYCVVKRRQAKQDREYYAISAKPQEPDVNEA